MMGFSKTAVFILLLATLSFAQSCIGNTTDIIIKEQGTNIGLVIGLSVILIAIAYAAGSMIGNQNFIIFSKDELFHLFFSIGLLLAFSGLVTFSCNLSDFFFRSTFENLGAASCYSSHNSPAEVSACYLTRLESKSRQASSEYIRASLQKLMASTFSIALPIPLSNTYTMTAGSYRRVHSQQYDMVLNSFLLPATLSISIQKVALDFISENVITWLLPIAFLLRIFVPTRQVGNMLIAMSIGLYIVIPLFYTFNLAMYDAVFSDCSAYTAVTDDYVFGDGCSPYGFWEVARLVPQAFFLPNLTIAMFITFMSSANKALKVIG